MPLKALKKCLGPPQTLKRFKSLLCDAYVVVICFNEGDRRFGDSFTICIDETFVVAQTCKTSYNGTSLCAFRCANKSVKRVECSCHCHGVYPLFIALSGG